MGDRNGVGCRRGFAAAGDRKTERQHKAFGGRLTIRGRGNIEIDGAQAGAVEIDLIGPAEGYIDARWNQRAQGVAHGQHAEIDRQRRHGQGFLGGQDHRRLEAIRPRRP